MSEEKRNRLAAAITVNVILLIAILAIVVICQVAAIVNKKNEQARLIAEIERYERAKDASEDELEYLKSEEYWYDLLIKRGYRPAGE